ncbi:MAG: hypothetical protein NT076_03265 [Candidatus Pacearchaeota archaeon]|nr:hypothetical protein [Candidatus Pacearchaeota archaeon]
MAKVISVINPDRYANNASEVKKLAKSDFWAAVKTVKPKEAYDGFEEHKITYDSSSETLEPVYFWVIDKLKEMVGPTEKLIDTFTSSPGSGHFSEMGLKATQMQEQATKILGNVNTVIKSIVNIIYDLKEFKIRLEQYSAANSKNKDEKEAGLLSLKQIWMDNVDVKRGRGSINMLAQDLNFVTIRDAFMMADSEEAVEKLDLNDRVKRILKPRVQEFLKWKDLSGKELKKRYDIEKTYLKSQVNSLKLYTRWARPYLRAASLLEQKESNNLSLVTAFNTILMELTLLSKKDFDFRDAVFNKNLPDSFRDLKLKRNYSSCVLTEFVFTGIPQRVGQHYTFGGRVEVTFRGYSLNDDEIKMLKQKLEESDMNEAMKLIQGTTDDSLKVLQEDLDALLKEDDEEKKEEAKGEDTNPFAALFGLAEKKPGKEEKKEEKKITEIKPDNYTEKLVRAITETSAREACFKVYDIYKKGHGMACHPDWYYNLNVQVPHSKWKGILGI